MKKAFYCSITILLLIFNTQVSFGQPSEAFRWLEGTWKMDVGSGLIVESWKIINDSTLQGKSVFVKASNDTILQESLDLVFRNGAWNYISTVQGQNDNQPVKFKVAYLKGADFICENPQHDFPQRIAYIRISANQILASIEGLNKGKYSKQNFLFNKD